METTAETAPAAASASAQHKASASVAGSGDETALRERVLQTQVTRLIEGSTFGNLVGYGMAVIWVGLIWNKLPHEVLSVWIGAMSFLFLFRALVHYLKLYEVEKTGAFAEVMRRWYLLAVLLTGAVWGVTSILMFPYAQIEQVVLAFILVGVSASGVIYANVGWVYCAFVGLVLLPLMIRLFSIGGEIYYALAAMTGFFIGVMMLAAWRIYRSSSDALLLSYKNMELIENLTRAQQQLEGANRNLQTEIEHVKLMERELKRERDRAEKMSAAKGEFLANMSHEIRTPMNGVIGTLQLLEDTRLDNSQAEYVRTAHKSADALLSILNDILDLSKIEAGKLDIEIIRFDLREVINDLVTLHALKAEQKGVILRSKIDEALPQRVMGDPTRLRQIVINLISNALKFTEQGEINVRLQVLATEADKLRVRIEVQDTGVGISEDVQQKLFTAFTQADGSTTRKYGGTGLGLAIVRQLVGLMHGDIGVDSRPGEGSTFWFEVPLGRAADSDEPEDGQTAETADHSPLSGTILLAEDNPVNQMVAAKMLEKSGIDCVIANNGAEALQKLETHRFDAVLMDCQMPEMDGFEATRRIREQEQAAGVDRIPVIAMTANVMEGDRELCLQAGMDDYLGKPVKQEELEHKLRKWLQAQGRQHKTR